MGEFKELQINIFYDLPSANCVPPWQPLVARRCPRGWGWGLGRRPRGRGGGEGGERRALGLNFHLSNPGPAHWLRARRPGSGCWRDQLLHSRGVRPAGRGAAVWGEEILGAKLHGVGAGGGCGLTPLRKTSGWDTRSIPTHALLPLHRYVFAPTSEAGDFTKMSLRPEYPERCRAGPNLPLLPLPGSLAVCGGAPDPL